MARDFGNICGQNKAFCDRGTYCLRWGYCGNWNPKQRHSNGKDCFSWDHTPPACFSATRDEAIKRQKESRENADKAGKNYSAKRPSNLCRVKTEIDTKGHCGKSYGYCDPGRYCSFWGLCGPKDTHKMTGVQRVYSGNYLPKACLSLSSEIELEEYNGFEEHESGYSGLDLLITMGAGMISGMLGAWYVRKNDK